MARRIDERQHLGNQRIIAKPGPHLLQPLLEHALVAEQRSETPYAAGRRSAPCRSRAASGRSRSGLASRARLPITLPNGITSASTPDTPPIIAARPMRTNWWIAAAPADHRVVGDGDVAAHDHVVGDDHVIADLAVMRATCATAMIRQSAPTRVMPRPVTVPRWMVQCSRICVRAPISQRVGSPWYFRSCGSNPTVQNGNNTAPGPDRRGWPSTTTCETRRAPSSITAWAPTLAHHGPIRTPVPSFRAARRRSRWDGSTL